MAYNCIWFAINRNYDEQNSIHLPSSSARGRRRLPVVRAVISHQLLLFAGQTTEAPAARLVLPARNEGGFGGEGEGGDGAV